MNNKRGNLLTEETVKIIIGVICLTFLAFFLFQIYNSYSSNKEMEQGKASLKHIIDELNLMKVGETKNVVIYNPVAGVKDYFRYWFLVSFEKNNLPTICSNKGWENCLCICKDEVTTKSRIKECENTGYCLESNKVVLEEEVIKIIAPPLNININKKDTNTIIIKKG